MGKMHVRSISEGLIREVAETEGTFLCEVIDRHEYLGLLIPGVCCLCDSGRRDIDEHLFIFAFLEVLRHHVNIGQIKAFHENEEAKNNWNDWQMGKLKARRLHRPYDSLERTSAEILPKKFCSIVQTSLSLSTRALEMFKVDSGKIIHLDYVECRSFKKPAWLSDD